MDYSIEAAPQFCVYRHMRPWGEVFYVGKGLIRRAWDFSPSRRTKWHQNVVAKHGRENIGVEVIPCASEQEAFALERAQIVFARELGHRLVNLTEGGEGCSGRQMTEKQAQGLIAGRRKGKPGQPGDRPELQAWRATPQFSEHLRKLGEAGAARLHQERQIACGWCEKEFTSRTLSGKYCCLKCGKAARKARG